MREGVRPALRLAYALRREDGKPMGTFGAPFLGRGVGPVHGLGHIVRRRREEVFRKRELEFGLAGFRGAAKPISARVGLARIEECARQADLGGTIAGSGLVFDVRDRGLRHPPASWVASRG